MSELLLEVETIDAQQIKDLMDGKTVAKKKASRKSATAKKTAAAAKEKAKKSTKSAPKK